MGKVKKAYSASEDKNCEEKWAIQFSVRWEYLADRSATVQMKRICYIVVFIVKLKFKALVVSALNIKRKALWNIYQHNIQHIVAAAVADSTEIEQNLLKMPE